MRIEVRTTGELGHDVCQVVNTNLKSIKTSLESTVIDNREKNSASKQVKNQLLNRLIEEGWRPRFKVDKYVSEIYPAANYLIDAIKDFTDSTCGHRHRFFVEFCFDNRQAIGTNLLKFEIASKNTFDANLIPHSILICADDEALKHFGWDPSIASADEYDHAMRIAYKNIITNPINFFVILI